MGMNVSGQNTEVYFMNIGPKMLKVYEKQPKNHRNVEKVENT